ncbi:hypothetical protein COO60DRAFT_542384 [Scenedesmus sp. NREL 46B-D3]|nr:hypothetical protein COO60DRAFT_542384 [Scenedesmus sp. NREL 46B-D3]
MHQQCRLQCVYIDFLPSRLACTVFCLYLLNTCVQCSTSNVWGVECVSRHLAGLCPKCSRALGGFNRLQLLAVAHQRCMQTADLDPVSGWTVWHDAVLWEPSLTPSMLLLHLNKAH